MADKWFEQNIEKELKKYKNTLEGIKEQGFIEDEKFFGYYKMYSKGNERVFYDPLKKKVICKFSLDNLMKGTI
ncbi:MAG TPA: hypothetical protein ENG87_05050 [Candidatus Pacearchaeota archaeon]|nr:hypothetical protein [Candidatus Pacearchaeota archaeon]